jgi:hypothetical protein
MYSCINWNPYEDLNHAFMCLEVLRSQGYFIALQNPVLNWRFGIKKDGVLFPDELIECTDGNLAKTISQAICNCLMEAGKYGYL